jgi:hypothetical protein
MGTSFWGCLFILLQGLASMWMLIQILRKWKIVCGSECQCEAGADYHGSIGIDQPCWGQFAECTAVVRAVGMVPLTLYRHFFW